MRKSRAAVPQNGYTIRAMREREGLSRADLAERIGISESHLRNIENEYRAVSPEDLFRIADLLHVTPAALTRVRASDAVGQGPAVLERKRAAV